MAITVTITPRLHLYSPQPPVDVPCGHWTGLYLATGNATGGHVQVSVISTSPGSYLWSWEESSLDIDQNLTPAYYEALLTGEVRDVPGGTAQLDFRRAGILGNLPIVAMADMFSYSLRGFKYICHPDIGASPAFVLSVDNVNGLHYYLSWWGYIWRRQALYQSGLPPRRP